MKKRNRQLPTYETIQLGNITYAVLPETLLQAVCRRAGVHVVRRSTVASESSQALSESDVDPDLLARRLTARRQQVGLTQTELAKLSGLRPETINRIERGRTSPDFKTIRKLVVAMNQSEKREHVAALGKSKGRETTNSEA